MKDLGGKNPQVRKNAIEKQLEVETCTKEYIKIGMHAL